MKTKTLLWTAVMPLIFISLIALAVLCFCLSRVWIQYSDLLVNLSAGFIGSLITIFGIETLTKRKREQRWSDAKDAMNEDLSNLKNSLAYTMLFPLGVGFPRYKGDEKHPEVWGPDAFKYILADLVKKDLHKLLNDLSVRKWRLLRSSLPSVRDRLSENINLYGEIMPPELFGKLLKVRAPLNSFYESFDGPHHELFTEQQEDWPQFYGSNLKDNIAMRKRFLNQFSEHLKDYFENLRNLIEYFEEDVGSSANSS